MVEHLVEDLTSGFLGVNISKFREFIPCCQMGFHIRQPQPWLFSKAGYSVGYVSIRVDKRVGESHIRLLKDGTRFLLIIFKIGTLYSPLKLFFPISLFISSNRDFYYLYTFIDSGRFTNMIVVAVYLRNYFSYRSCVDKSPN